MRTVTAVSDDKKRMQAAARMRAKRKRDAACGLVQVCVKVRAQDKQALLDFVASLNSINQ